MTQSLAQAVAPVDDPAPESPWQHLNPRRHLAAAVGWAAFILMAFGALIAGELAASTAEREMRADTQARLVQTAGQTSDALLAQVEVLLAAMQATAAQWRLDAAVASTTRERLRALQHELPALGWIGLQDAQGALVAATDADTTPTALAPELGQGLRTPRVILRRARSATDADALLLAVPLAGSDQPAGGVLVAQLPWLWLQAELDARLRAMAGGVPLQVLLLDPVGRLLAGPAPVRDATPPVDWTEGGRYLLGRPAHDTEREVPIQGVGWQVVVREDAALALARARHARRAVLAGVLAVGLLAALAVVLVASRPLGRLDELARQARSVRAGRRDTVAVPPGRDEVHAIGATLAQLIRHLQDEKLALARLNAELDARVTARTARIERMAQDARRAAVTRERLRLARELHDTLAHSLMALLTQIRVARKLGGNWSRDELDAQLRDAEQVATDGLADVRAAIGQMRESGVHDSGLGPELHRLLLGLAERTGIEVDEHIDAAAVELTDERAATVFSVAREALRNVERHAKASRVTLHLAPEGELLADGDAPMSWRLELADDGAGFDPLADAAGHWGLVGLQEQAAQMGATLSVHSAPGSGCRVALRFLA